MDDPTLVRIRQRAHHGQHQLHGATRRHRRVLAGGRRVLAQPLPQRLALEVLEHHVRLAVLLTDLVDDDDVLVHAVRGGARLAQEALGQPGSGRAQPLDRDQPSEAQVAGQVHLAHATSAQGPDELVLAEPRARHGLTRSARRRGSPVQIPGRVHRMGLGRGSRGPMAAGLVCMRPEHSVQTRALFSTQAHAVEARASRSICSALCSNSSSGFT